MLLLFPPLSPFYGFNKTKINFKKKSNSFHQIALRAAFLERENSALKNQVQVLNNKNKEMKKDVEQLRLNIQMLQDNQVGGPSAGHVVSQQLCWIGKDIVVRICNFIFHFVTRRSWTLEVFEHYGSVLVIATELVLTIPNLIQHPLAVLRAIISLPGHGHAIFH